MLTVFLPLIVLFAFVCIEYKWTGALYFTLLVGFLQDPIRKLAETDSTYLSGLIFVFFLLTFFVIKQTYKRWYLDIICWSNPRLISLLSIFSYFLFFQALNSYARFNDLRLTIVGLVFYGIPLIGLWVGFITGSNYIFIRRLLIVYFIGTCICGATVYLDFLGVENRLFKEVGLGLDITGFGEGASGVWRTSEIAAWHLAAGACIGFLLGMTEKRTFQQILYFALSLGLALLSTTTGRRKALGMIIVFVSMFLLTYSFISQENKLFRTVSVLVLALTLSIGTLGIFLPGDSSAADQNNKERVTERTSSLTVDAVTERVEVQGIRAFMRGVEIAGPIGLGVGAGSNSGNTGIGQGREDIRSLSYVSEGGGGRIIAELGILGGILMFYLLVNALILTYKNLVAGIRYMDPEVFLFFVGLLLFTLVNAAAFFAASQLYSDIFVLIMVGISFGAFTALPISIGVYRKSA